MDRRVPAQRLRLLVASATLSLLVSMLPAGAVNAAVVVTAATGGAAISADTAGSTYTALTGPSLAASAAADFGTGSDIVLNIPAGFVFRAGFGSATPSGGCTGLVLAPLVVTTTTATLGITTGPSDGCTITFTGLEVQPTAGTPLAAGNITNTGSAGPGGSENYGTLTEVPGTAILSFATQPSPANTAATAFATQPVVHSEDQFGNDRAGDSILLSITPGTGAAGATLTCTTNPVLTSGTGDAAFAGCSIERAAGNYQLRAATTGDTDDSSVFSVAVGPAHHLSYVATPNQQTPALLTPQPVVGVYDAGGNLVNDSGRTISLTISMNPGTFSCAQGLTRLTSAGVATFTGCQQTTVANFYNLTADDGPGGLSPVLGPPFSVTSGVAAELRICWGPTLPCITTPPAGIAGGAEFLVQPVVRVTDAAGNTVVSDNTTVVTLAKTPNTPASGGPGTLTCANSQSRTAVNGVATFDGCRIDRAGTGYRLRATSAPALTMADSNLFNVVVGEPVKLGVIAQPTGGGAGAALSPNIQVAIQDLGGNTVATGISAVVNISINPNASGAVLTCTNGTSVLTSNGVATFQGCRIDRPGLFTIVAAASNVQPLRDLTGTATTPINVSQPPAQINLSASSSVITWGGSVMFSIAFAAQGANRPFTLQSSPNNSAWTTIATPPLLTNASGVASFSYRPARNLYYRAVFAGASDLGAANSNVVRVVVRQIALLRPTNLGQVDHISPDTTIRFTTTVRPARPELPRATVTFVVYRLVGRAWVLAASQNVQIDAAGVAAVDITFGRAGRWYVRSIARPTSANANSVWGPIERYDVP